MPLSAHQALPALAFAQTHAPNACLMAVPPQIGPVHEARSILAVRKTEAGKKVRHINWTAKIASPLPYGEEGGLVVLYRYPALSVKGTAQGTLFIPQKLDPVKLGLLWACLQCGEGLSFIPSQLGLPPLFHKLPSYAQARSAYSLHPHHRIDLVEWRKEPPSGATVWSPKRHELLARLERGYDVDAGFSEIYGD